MDSASLNVVLLVGSAILLLAVLAVRASVRIGLPSMLLYLAMGVLLGESVLGFRFDDADTAQALGLTALALILAEGGLTTKWSEVRPSMLLGLLLASVGVGVTVGVVAVGAHLLLAMPWRTAFLLGAITAPTDAAAVFSVLRRVPLRPRILGVLEAESGLNDAPTVLLVTVLSSTDAMPGGTAGIVGLIGLELAGGALLGVLLGLGSAWLLRRVALPASGLYPITVLALCMLAYAGTATAHLSGFAAVYAAALVLGNSELSHGASTRSFAEGVAWLAQIGLFVMLGLLVSPGTFGVGDVVGGIVVGALLTLVARPLSVAACAAPLRIAWQEQAFVAVAGLRGAVPIVLAAIPLAHGVDKAEDMFNLVFVLVVVLTLVVAPGLPRLATSLGVTAVRPRDLDVEAAPLERIAAVLLQVTVTRHSRMHGVEVGELRLPQGTSVSLVVRGDTSFSPSARTAFRRGDEVLIVTPRADRELVERRIQAVSRRGRLAGWTARNP